MLLRSLAFGLTLCMVQAIADDEYGSRRRNSQRDRYRDRGAYDNRGYGYSSNRDYRASRVVEQTLSDLQRAYSRNRVDNHERDHFERATRELRAFRNNWSRGDWDGHRLDRAIEDLSDLAQAHQVHPRDRQMLARDLSMLRQFRESRGGGYYSR